LQIWRNRESRIFGPLTGGFDAAGPIFYGSGNLYGVAIDGGDDTGGAGVEAEARHLG